MSELEDVLGEDFAEEYEETTQKRRQQRRRVDKETLKQICYEAIYGGGWTGEEPRFVFEGEDIDHDVVLMEAPNQDMQKFRHPFEDGGISLGMFHQSQLWSCNFNEEMVELVDRIEEGKEYLVVGRYKETTRTEGGEESTYINISPVRGIVPLSKAKSLADEYESDMEGSSVEEQAQSQSAEQESEDEEMDLGGLDDEDDSGYDRDRVVAVLKQVANKKEEILHNVASGDSDALRKLLNVANDNIEGEIGEEDLADIFEEEVGEIEGRHEEEEEEDEEDLDLGLDEDEDEDESEVEETSSESSSSEDEEEDVEDWF